MKKGNVIQSRVFRIARTNTTAFQATNLPAQAVIIGCRTMGTASNAATTGVINLGTTSTSTEIGVLNVKTGSGLVYHELAEFASVALDTSLLGKQQDKGIPIFAKYSETGTASSAGGDWLVILEFI